MKISSGISTINIPSLSENGRVSGKTYIWPAYHEGAVEKIKAPGNRPQEPIYFKASPEQKEEILSSVRREESYSTQGIVSRLSHEIAPGSLFNALA